MADKEEISLKEILITIREWVAYLFSKWLIIFIVGFAGALTGMLYAWFYTPKYSASLNFILANSTQSNAGILGLASQFGIDLSSGDNSAFTGNNIIGLMKSRKMIQQALLQKPAGSNQSLLNLYCVNNKLAKGWQKSVRFKNAYPFPDSFSKMSRIQDSLFRAIYEAVQKANLDVSIPDKTQSIYNVICTSNDEIFSFYLTKYIVDVTSAFYIDTKTSMAKNNLAMLQHEADSLQNLLGGAITSTAAQTDVTFNLNPAYQVQRSSSQKSQVQATVWGTAYGEVVKNLELAKITLQKETPLYQVIDEPSLPLVMQKPGRLLSAITGGMIAGFLICGFLLIKKIFSNLK